METNIETTPQATEPKAIKRMKDEEYLRTQKALVGVSIELVDLDFDGFISRINMSETLGPILDPTLYRMAGERLAQIKKVVEAAKTLKTEVLLYMKMENDQDGANL